MGKEMLNSSPLLHKVKKSYKASLRSFDLPILIKKMKKSPTWANGELNAKILLKSPHKQIVLTALHEGTEISSFQANDSVTFQIIEGKLMFSTPKESVVLDKGQLLTIRENVRYRLTTGEETVFLLTIAKGSALTASN